jgi:hypothetical protein
MIIVESLDCRTIQAIKLDEYKNFTYCPMEKRFSFSKIDIKQNLIFAFNDVLTYIENDTLLVSF